MGKCLWVAASRAVLTVEMVTEQKTAVAGQGSQVAALRERILPRTDAAAAWAELPDVPALRTLAGRIRQHALDYLDYHLEQLEAAVAKRGSRLHWAADAEDARQIVREILASAACRRVACCRSTLTEELQLEHHLLRHGVELINPHSGDAGPAPVDNADAAVTGADLLIAQTGDACLIENLGAARRAMADARVHVCIAGIDQVVLRSVDAAVLLKLLSRSATGQPLPACVSLFGATSPGRTEFHLVLVDNGRTDIAASEHRPSLRCIHCGACEGNCPVDLPVEQRLASMQSVQLAVRREPLAGRIFGGVRRLLVRRGPRPTNGVMPAVRRALGRVAPLREVPAPPRIHEPIARLVHAEFGLSELFAARAAGNQTQVEAVDLGELGSALAGFLRGQGCRTVFVENSEFLQRLQVARTLSDLGFIAEHKVGPVGADCAITGVYAAVSETGSLVLAGGAEDARALRSPVHVAIVDPRRLVPDLIDLFEKFGSDHEAGCAAVLTGPPRRLDSQLNWIPPRHGPRILRAIVLR